MASTIVRLVAVLSLATRAASLKASTRLGDKLEPVIGDCPSGCQKKQCGTPDLRDIDRPITQVLQDQPGIDGWCYFSQLGAYWMQGQNAQVWPWMIRTMPTNTKKGLNQEMQALNKIAYKGTELFRIPFRMSHGVITVPEKLLPNVTLSYTDGDRTVELLTHLDPNVETSAYDITRYYAMGWLANQGANLALDNEMIFSMWWENVVKKDCQTIKEQDNFDDDTFTFRYHNEDRNLTLRDLRAHTYGKCLMGPSAAVKDMVYGFYAAGCLLPWLGTIDSQPENIPSTGHYVGHGEVECKGGYHKR